MREYKVEAIKLKSMGVVMLTGPAFEKLLNQMAAEGWLFDKVVQSVTGVLKNDLSLVVFYREKA